MPSPRLGPIAATSLLSLAGLSIVACSAGTTTGSTASADPSGSSGSSGDTEGDAASGVDGSTSPSDAGADAAPARGVTLTIDGVAIPVDQTMVTGSTKTDFNGTAWITKIKVPIKNAETYAWNTDKAPAFILIHDEQTRRKPLATGDFSCLRGPAGDPDYGFTQATIFTSSGNTLNDLLATRPADASCSVQLEKWAPDLVGSLDGEMVDPNKATPTKLISVVVTWNVPATK